MGRMVIPVCPIYVVEGYDIGIYSSVADAQLSIEPWWVQQHEGLVYDALGKMCKCEIQNSHVLITLADSAAENKEALATALREYLKYRGEVIRDDYELPTLVEISKKYQEDLGSSFLARILKMLGFK